MFEFVETKNYEEIELPEDQAKQVSNACKIRAALKKKDNLGLDVYLNSERIAFCLIHLLDDDDAFLWNYIVEPEFQHKGYGKAILNELFVVLKDKGYKEIITTYKCGNEVAKTVYEKVGFIQTEEVHDGDINEVNMSITL